MKVLHINSNYIFTWLHQKMLERLEGEEVTNTVFCPVSKTCKARITINDNVIVSRCFKKLDRLSFYYKQRKAIKALEQSVNVKDFDILHAYTLFTDGNIAYEINKRYGTPYVVAIRNTDMNAFFKYRPYLKSRALKILKNASAVFFLSDVYKNSVFKKYIPACIQTQIQDKTYVIPNGIDDLWLENICKKDAPKGEEIRLVYAGAIDQNKNIITSLKACKKLIQMGYSVKYTAIGKVADRWVFNQILQQSFATYLPPKTKEELMEIYKAQNIFVMPSFHETFGLVYAEAMSQGLPVIYSRGQGFDGQFEDGFAGYSVDSASDDEIAEAVIKILADYEKISQQCAKGCKRFNWKEISLEYIEIYKRILNNKR